MATLFQRSFAAGEIAPALHTRVDTIKYAYGLTTCRNFYIGKSGGAINRPGFKTFLTNFTPATYELSFKATPPRLIPMTGTGEEDKPGGGIFLEVNPYIGTRIIEDGAPRKRGNGTLYSALTDYPLGALVRANGVSGVFMCIKPVTGTPPPNTEYWLKQDYEDIYLPFTDVNAQYVQNGEAMIFASRVKGLVEISKVSNLWAVRPITGTGASGLVPSIRPPSSVSISPSAATNEFGYYVVTAVSSADFEESLPSAQMNMAGGSFDSVNARFLSWSPVPGAYSYNVYRILQTGRYGLVTTTTLPNFRDNNVSADYTEVAPEARTDLSDPAVIGLSQQRLVLANTTQEPGAGWVSRIGSLKNFSRKFLGPASESGSFKIVGSGAVKAVLEVGKTFIFTDKAEYSCEAITRTGPENLKKESENGCGSVPPIAIGQSAIYLQRGDSIFRSIGFDQAGGGLDGYTEGDLTTYSSHLFDGHKFVSIAYQQGPDSLIWAVRDDGILLSMTFMKQEGIIAWHRHDTDGFVERVIARSEGIETAIYITVRRMVNGVEQRFYERMSSRYPKDLKDYCFLDAAYVYDGRNKGEYVRVTLLNGNAWDDSELLTLKVDNYSDFPFLQSDEGKEFHIYFGGKTYRFSVEEYISNSELTVRAEGLVPSGLRGAWVRDFARASNTVSAPHLEGRDVGVYADGFVIASPNNPEYEKHTVTGGTLTLDRFYSVICVGLPITADLQTLDIDSAQTETAANKKINVNEVTVAMDKTRGGFVGASLPSDSSIDGLVEMVPTQVTYQGPSGMRSGKLKQPIFGGWESNGRIAIRQVDPLPINILGVAPSGLMPFGG